MTQQLEIRFPRLVGKDIGRTIIEYTNELGRRLENNFAYLALGDSRVINTLAVDDTTPSVQAVRGYSDVMWQTANTSATTISNFDDGYLGQEIWVFIGDANTTIDFTSSNLKGNGGVDFSASQGDHLHCIFDGTNWRCLVGTV